MIHRRILHLEAHWGYWPRISFRKVSQAGDITPWGALTTCDECSGDGLLAESPQVPEHFAAAVTEFGVDPVKVGWVECPLDGRNCDPKDHTHD